MNHTEMYHFVQQYLQATGCTILDQQESVYIQTQLSIEADKDITGRPYYWMFVERTGTEPQPLTLTFIFDEERLPENVQGELIKFGCWRLHQMFASAKKRGQFICLYEVCEQADHTQALIPWLNVNVKISFIADQKKDIYYPLGINLMNGEMIGHFDQILERYELSPKIPDYHFKLTPVFSINSAAKRMEEHIEQFILEQDHRWAEQAHQRVDEERALIETFYEAEEEQHEVGQARIEEVERYRPYIEVQPINTGLLYLQSHPLHASSSS